MAIAAPALAAAPASATPTPQYPLDPAAEAASKQYPGPARTATIQARAALAFVSVPAGYVYDTSMQPIARHDYCTTSPDTYFAADFRGPCARHDMCYDRADAAGTGYGPCNDALRADMRTNCAYAYDPATAAYTTCLSVADIYWAAVTVAHLGSN